MRHPRGVGQRDRAAQGGDAGVGRPGRDGRRPRLDDGLDRAVGGDLDGRARPLVPGRLDRGARRDPELVVEQRGERPVLALGGLVVAGEAVEPDDERLVVLVERAHRRRAHREAAGPVELAAGQQPERGLVQHRLGRRGQPPPLREQPRLERRCPAHHRPLEQLAPEAGHLHRLDPRAARERDDVDQHVVREGQHHRVALDGPSSASARRISARLQRSARSGSSASAKSSSASRARPVGRSVSSR